MWLTVEEQVHCFLFLHLTCKYVFKVKMKPVTFVCFYSVLYLQGCQFCLGLNDFVWLLWKCATLHSNCFTFHFEKWQVTVNGFFMLIYRNRMVAEWASAGGNKSAPDSALAQIFQQQGESYISTCAIVHHILIAYTENTF